MPAEIIEVPLGLRTRFPNGEATHHFANLPLPRLARDLLDGLVVMCSPNGSVRSRWSACSVTSHFRSAIRALHTSGFAGSADDLRAEHLLAVCNNYAIEEVLRPCLRAYEEEHPGRLHDSVRRFLDGAWVSPPRSYAPVPPYTPEEEARLREACRASIAAVEARVEAARAEAATGSPYRTDTATSRASLLWTLEAEGPLSRQQIASRLGLEGTKVFWPAGLPRIREAAAALWPTAVDLVAYRTLLGLETGIVPEGIASLRLSDLQRVSAREVIIAWEKQRGGGRESDRFGGAGEWSPGRIFERAIQITAGPRRHSDRDDSARLWIALHPTQVRVYRMRRPSQGVVEAWLRQSGLSTEEDPFDLKGRRLRKTFYRRLDERFGGAIPSVAGANQSESVAAEHYLSVTQSSEFLEGVVEAAYAEALRKVERAGRPTVLSQADVARLSGDDTSAAAELGVAPAEAGPLLSGERDVFAAACRDFYHSPYGSPGSPCPAAVWACLFCPLAVITPAKLPTLLALADHVDAQRAEMPADEWTRIYGAVWHQLSANILPRYPEAVIRAARVKADAAALYLPPTETNPGPIR